MKKVKIILAVVAMLCLVSAFAGCGTASFKKVYTGQYDADTNKIVDVKEDLDALESSGSYFYGTKTNETLLTQYFYNKDGELKLTLANTDKVEYERELPSFNCVTIKRTEEIEGEDDKVTYSYYDYEFNVLVADSENTVSIEKKGKFLFVGNDFYQLDKDGNVVIASKKSAGINLAKKKAIAQSSTLTFNGLYYGMNSGVLVYNDNLDLVADYITPSYVTMGGVTWLPNGNLLIQLREELDINAKKYTYEEDGVKYNIYTEIVNVKNGKVRRIRTTFVVGGGVIDGMNLDFAEAGISTKLKAICYGFDIKNKRIDRSEADYDFFVLNNNGKIKKYIAKSVIGQQKVLTNIADNRYTVTDIAGTTYLINENGENLGIVPSSFALKGGVYAQQINNNFVVFDANLKEVKSYDIKLNASSHGANINVFAVKYTTEDNKKMVDIFVGGKLFKTLEVESFGDIKVNPVCGYSIETTVDSITTKTCYDDNGNEIISGSVMLDNDIKYANYVYTKTTAVDTTITKSFKILVSSVTYYD